LLSSLTVFNLHNKIFTGFSLSIKAVIAVSLLNWAFSKHKGLTFYSIAIFIDMNTIIVIFCIFCLFFLYQCNFKHTECSRNLTQFAPNVWNECDEVSKQFWIIRISKMLEIAVKPDIRILRCMKTYSWTEKLNVSSCE
jgi:hypothetical protein